MTNQSRRSFLQGSIVGAAALASASVVQAAPRSKVPAKWDETVDVIVVGSGFAVGQKGSTPEYFVTNWHVASAYLSEYNYAFDSDHV